jgi:hypothetical protein
MLQKRTFRCGILGSAAEALLTLLGFYGATGSRALSKPPLIEFFRRL